MGFGRDWISQRQSSTGLGQEAFADSWTEVELKKKFSSVLRKLLDC